MVLARVPKNRIPKNRIKDKSACEFFQGVEKNGSPLWTPLWTKNVSERRAVFTHPGRCYRSQVTYNAARGRYLSGYDHFSVRRAELTLEGR